MNNKYYVVLVNSKTGSYVTTEIRVSTRITKFDDVINLKISALKSNKDKFLLTDDLDWNNWVVVNWKRFEEEE